MPATALAFIEIKQSDIMPEFGVARDSAAAGVFRIAGMAARHDDLQLPQLCRLCGHGRGNKRGGDC